MNENINLTKILKNCPAGTKLYSPIYGEIYFEEIRSNDRYPISTITKSNYTATFTKEGFHFADEEGECVLFPSKKQRDWNKFSAPWYKKEKFDPKTLNPFDRVLVRNFKTMKWRCEHFSHFDGDNYNPYIASCCSYTFCIPYNDDTKHLIGTKEEAPDFYKYWEE